MQREDHVGRLIDHLHLVVGDLEASRRFYRAALGALETSARDEDANLMSDLIDCVKSEATIQEICDVLRGVFGEAEPVKL